MYQHRDTSGYSKYQTQYYQSLYTFHTGYPPGMQAQRRKFTVCWSIRLEVDIMHSACF